MHFGNYLKVAGLSAAAAFGFAVSAFGQSPPYEYYQEKSAPNKGDMSMMHHYDLDFTKTSANPALNYQTFTNPRSGGTVKYAPHRIVAGVSPGGCYDIASTGPIGSDLIISVQNQAGNWMWLADDNQGAGQFRARVYIKPSAQYEFRISEYSSNSNNQNNIYVMKLNLDAGSAITATSCRQSGVPFWQYDLNSGNPYNPS